MGMESIEELFEHELKDILGGEQSLLDALNKLKAIGSEFDVTDESESDELEKEEEEITTSRR